jgi:MerC mercury resistance protein
MPRRFHTATLDRMAVGLSGLCVLHCVLSVALIAMLSGAGTVLTDPIIHKLGLGGAVILAGVALRQGYLSHGAKMPLGIGLVGLALMALGLVVPHGWPEVAATVAGVTVLAAAHLMNARARA